MAPVVDRLAKEYEGTIEIRKLNVETDGEAADLAASYRVQYVPTFVFLNSDGSTSDVLVGEQTEDQLKGALEALR